MPFPRIAIAWAILVLILGGCDTDRLKQALAPYADVTNNSKASGLPETKPSSPVNTHIERLQGAMNKPPSQVNRPEPEVFVGTGRFVADKPATLTEAEITTAGDIELNFVNADLREVLRTVFVEILNANYLIDPGVQGTLTLQTNRAIDRMALLSTLQTILRSMGIAVLETDGTYRIVPSALAPRLSGAPDVALPTSRGARGFSIQIVPLTFVSATEMREILQPVAPQNGILQVDRDRNLIVLAGTRQEIGAMLDTINIFDVDWLAGMSFAMFPLRSVDPVTLVAELGEILRVNDGPLADLIRLVPMERLNSVLAISPQPQYLKQVRIWIERLDHQAPSDDVRLYVYYVQNGLASDLAEVLTRSLSDGLEGGTSGTSAVRPLDGGLPAVGRQPESDPSQATTPSDETGNAPSGPRRVASVALAGARAPRITADERNNALLVVATPREWAILEAALRDLDIIPLQVLIEAAIAEVQLNQDLRYGVQWFFESGNSSVTLSEVNTGAIAQQFPGFSYLFSGSSDIRVVLNALEGVTDVKVISSPQIMVINNQPAILQVGDQVPVATQSAVSVTDTDSPIVNTIQFRDTGVILEVTPRVNDSGLVIMEISQEVSDVVETTTSGIDSPTIQQRRLQSTVAVKDGQTIALGGLIRDDEQEVRSGVPFVQHLPFVGPLFRSTVTNDDRTELLVLLTPRVARDPEDARRITDELRRRIDAVRPLDRRVQ